VLRSWDDSLYAFTGIFPLKSFPQCWIARVLAGPALSARWSRAREDAGDPRPFNARRAWRLPVNGYQLANANKRQHIRWVNTLLNLATPEIVTPMQLVTESADGQ